jgi:hypothetical protein
MKKAYTIKRICAGLYEVGYKGKEYTVRQFHEGPASTKGKWIVANLNDQYEYSDFFDTKWEAMRYFQD